MLIKKNKEVISWSFYDFANQPFSTVILTFIYGTFFTQYIAKDSEGTFLWTVGISITAIIASILSPLLGAYSDSKGFRKHFFVLFTWMCVFFSCMLYFPELGDVCLAMSLFIAAIIFSILTWATANVCSYNYVIKKKSNIIEELSKEIDISLGNTRVYYFRELNCKKADLSFDMIRMMENIEVISVMFYQYFTTDITGKPLGEK